VTAHPAVHSERARTAARSLTIHTPHQRPRGSHGTNQWELVQHRLPFRCCRAAFPRRARASPFHVASNPLSLAKDASDAWGPASITALDDAVVDALERAEPTENGDWDGQSWTAMARRSQAPRRPIRKRRPVSSTATSVALPERRRWGGVGCRSPWRCCPLARMP
jgi:hypothetical protein